MSTACRELITLWRVVVVVGKLNLDGDDHKKVYSYTGCAVWKDKTVAPEIYDDLTEYRKETIACHQKIGAMKPIPSIMESIRKQ